MADSPALSAAVEEEERSSFKSPQSFGKAKRKVEKALPYSPRKRRKVIEHFATSYTDLKAKSEQQHPKAQLHISGPHIMHTLHIFSDGAASQFKQKYNLCNITFIPDLKVH